MACAVWGCDNSTGNPSVHYYVFPKQPEMAQQWVDACGWPPNQIDLNNALICSIHFSESSYTTETQLVDYTTCYTKLLKFDAVPTLYLPVTRLIIEKNDPQNIEHVTPKIEMQDSDLEKYKHIATKEALAKLENQNKATREKVVILENEIRKLRAGLEQKMESYKEKDVELSNLHSEFLQTRRSFLTVQQQRVLLGKVFSESQIKILSGKKKIYWSNDDMAVGYTIRHLSNKRCYMYLTKKLNIPLPAVSSIKRWMNLKNDVKKRLSVEVHKKDEDNSD